MTNQIDKPTPSRPKSYVRRGRITASQRQALEDYGKQVLLPIDTELSIEHAFHRRPQHLCMEIGFGMGENMWALALENPSIDFLGVEVHAPGTGKLVRDIHQAGVNNLRLYQHDVIDVLNDVIPANSVNSCLIFFPDPWPKSKHHKRRLIQPSFVDLLWKVLATQGVVWVATDWQPYAEYIKDVFEHDSRWAQTDQTAVPFSRKLTRFELRGTLSQHTITDCLWHKL